MFLNYTRKSRGWEILQPAGFAASCPAILYVDADSYQQSWSPIKCAKTEKALWTGSWVTYRVSIKALLLHINLRTATTIATNLVSRYNKVTMRYTVRSVTALPRGNQRS
ncbi:hypothetical protein AVEN_129077-1 [Araneus ventricosus]|uniref:Uncharacterized protein n=1 Tax=Araneus ventricosus TaxID=182803 RepID=A0A4Y2PMU0_ARAVE|nr:hypothetical protein AVEN_129077-1 [Araneus ventricosus]